MIKSQYNKYKSNKQKYMSRNMGRQAKQQFEYLFNYDDKCNNKYDNNINFINMCYNNFLNNMQKLNFKASFIKCITQMQFIDIGYKKKQRILKKIYDYCINNNHCICSINTLNDFGICVSCQTNEQNLHNNHILNNLKNLDCKHCVDSIIHEKRKIYYSIKPCDLEAETLYNKLFLSYSALTNEHFPNAKREFAICYYENNNYTKFCELVETFEESYLNDNIATLMIKCYEKCNVNILTKQNLIKYSIKSVTIAILIANTLLKKNPCSALKYLYNAHLQLFSDNCLHIISKIFINSNNIDIETQQIISTYDFGHLPNNRNIMEKIYIYKISGIIPNNLNCLLEFQTINSLADNPKELDIYLKKIYTILLPARLLRYISGFLFI